MNLKNEIENNIKISSKSINKLIIKFNFKKGFLELLDLFKKLKNEYKLSKSEINKFLNKKNKFILNFFNIWEKKNLKNNQNLLIKNSLKFYGSIINYSFYLNYIDLIIGFLELLNSNNLIYVQWINKFNKIINNLKINNIEIKIILNYYNMISNLLPNSKNLIFEKKLLFNIKKLKKFYKEKKFKLWTLEKLIKYCYNFYIILIKYFNKIKDLTNYYKSLNEIKEILENNNCKDLLIEINIVINKLDTFNTLKYKRNSSISINIKSKKTKKKTNNILFNFNKIGANKTLKIKLSNDKKLLNISKNYNINHIKKDKNNKNFIIKKKVHDQKINNIKQIVTKKKIKKKLYYSKILFIQNYFKFHFIKNKIKYLRFWFIKKEIIQLNKIDFEYYILFFLKKTKNNKFLIDIILYHDSYYYVNYNYNKWNEIEFQNISMFNKLKKIEINDLFNKVKIKNKIIKLNKFIFENNIFYFKKISINKLNEIDNYNYNLKKLLNNIENKMKIINKLSFKNINDFFLKKDKKVGFVSSMKFVNLKKNINAIKTNNYLFINQNNKNKSVVIDQESIKNFIRKKASKKFDTQYVINLNENDHYIYLKEDYNSINLLEDDNININNNNNLNILDNNTINITDNNDIDSFNINNSNFNKNDNSGINLSKSTYKSKSQNISVNKSKSKSFSYYNNNTKRNICLNSWNNITSKKISMSKSSLKSNSIKDIYSNYGSLVFKTQKQFDNIKNNNLRIDNISPYKKINNRNNNNSKFFDFNTKNLNKSKIENYNNNFISQNEESKNEESKIKENKNMNSELTDNKNIDSKNEESKIKENKNMNSKLTDNKNIDSKNEENKIKENKNMNSKLTDNKNIDSKNEESKNEESKYEESKNIYKDSNFNDDVINDDNEFEDFNNFNENDYSLEDDLQNIDLKPINNNTINEIENLEIFKHFIEEIIFIQNFYKSYLNIKKIKKQNKNIIKIIKSYKNYFKEYNNLIIFSLIFNLNNHSVFEIIVLKNSSFNNCLLNYKVINQKEELNDDLNNDILNKLICNIIDDNNQDENFKKLIKITFFKKHEKKYNAIKIIENKFFLIINQIYFYNIYFNSDFNYYLKIIIFNKEKLLRIFLKNKENKTINLIKFSYSSNHNNYIDKIKKISISLLKNKNSILIQNKLNKKLINNLLNNQFNNDNNIEKEINLNPKKNNENNEKIINTHLTYKHFNVDNRNMIGRRVKKIKNKNKYNMTKKEDKYISTDDIILMENFFTSNDFINKLKNNKLGLNYKLVIIENDLMIIKKKKYNLKKIKKDFYNSIIRLKLLNVLTFKLIFKNIKEMECNVKFLRNCNIFLIKFDCVDYYLSIKFKDLKLCKKRNCILKFFQKILVKDIDFKQLLISNKIELKKYLSFKCSCLINNNN